MTTVSDQTFLAYIETFHRTYAAAAEKFVAPGHRHMLTRYAFLPSRIVGYISTNFGLAIEYESSATENSFEIIKSSRRIEEIIFKPPKWLSTEKAIFLINAHGINLYGLSFIDCHPLRLGAKTATDPITKPNVTVANIEFQTGDISRRIRFAEFYGNRTGSEWTQEAATSRALQEIREAATDAAISRHIGLGLPDFVAEVKEQTVALLGSYSKKGRRRLEEVAIQLKPDYNPILVDDLDDMPVTGLRQKGVLLAGASRFVVLEDSEPGGQILELEKCYQNECIVVVLRERGQHSSFMTHGYGNTSKLVKEFEYTTDDLPLIVEEATKWAEATFADLDVKHRSTYPWLIPTDEPSTSGPTP